ncbi:MAG: hypothetical protein Q9223_003783 [Gallowayella weberi]
MLAQEAVSVSLPTWKSCVAYEEGEEWVLKKMNNGYPRFFIDKTITALAGALIQHYGTPDEWAILLPSHKIAMRCLAFFQNHLAALGSGETTRIIDLLPRADPQIGNDRSHIRLAPMLSAVIYPKRHSAVAKSFWQHTGEGISSRRAELCHRAFNDGFLAPMASNEQTDNRRTHLAGHKSIKGPLRYQKARLQDGAEEEEKVQPISHPEEKRHVTDDSILFVEERYGRNLDLSLAREAKIAIRRRIAGALLADNNLDPTADGVYSGTGVRQVAGFSEDDVYLYPSGMSSIFNAHRVMLASRAEDLDDLEHRCKQGEKYLALFCEFPGNPLLQCPDLGRIRTLADQFDFAVVVDETIGNFLNIHVMPHADVIVSSLTKVFSGDSNVMGGSLILNPQSRYYHKLKKTIEVEYEDNYWAEDALFMERNSRDFVSRIARINQNAEAISSTLKNSSLVKDVYYPKYTSTRCFYDQYRNPAGGYGGLLSVTFHTRPEAIAFYDALETAKGPSLGTNFTLRFFELIPYSTSDADVEQLSLYSPRALHRIGVGEPPNTA